jgi:hypothetical protein
MRQMCLLICLVFAACTSPEIVNDTDEPTLNAAEALLGVEVEADESARNNSCRCDGAYYCCWNGRLDEHSNVECNFSARCQDYCYSSGRRWECLP